MTRMATKVTVSGSFRRHLPAIARSVETFVDRGCRVLSPEDPRVVDSFGEFLFVASDRFRGIRTVQNRHLAAISASDLLWLVDPEGYVGQSASLELGYAIAVGTPVFSASPPSDLTLRQYVTVVVDEAAALSQLRLAQRSELGVGAVLIDPLATTEKVHATVDDLCRRLLSPSDPASDLGVAQAASEIRAAVDVRRDILLP